MAPLVSILIPAYNAQAWIADSIDSASAQTWRRKEIIVVDDGSRDRTYAVARTYSSPSVRVVTQENRGASAARNEAFRLCQGDYIQWLDADDLLAPEKIARQMRAVEEGIGERTMLSSAYGSFMYRVSRAQFCPTPLWCDLSPLEWLLRKMAQNLHMQTATWLVGRILTEAAGPWDTRLSLDDDGEYFSRVLLASTGVHFLSDARVFYRASGTGSLSFVDHSEKKLESQLLSVEAHLRYLQSMEKSERVTEACLRYLQSRFVNFYPEAPRLAQRLQELATSLGGHLQIPPLGWKFAWLAPMFGYAAAKSAREFFRALKWSSIRLFDRALWYLERARLRGSSDKSEAKMGARVRAER
ncbi:MAG: glycosyl transferase family 2 [Chthoniobacterales bacterium]|nr:MAG: glycosyl transferase family 2 [Chthoniobacterales bacterium]